MPIKFEIIAEDKVTRARAGLLHTPHGVIETPVFMPVGTCGTVKGMRQEELEALGVQILLGNTYHLYLRPGHELIRDAGGLHRFMSWPRPILTDSGGFQVMSLKSLGKVTEDGVWFKSHLDGSSHFLSPERAVEIQLALGSDIMMCLDECVEYPTSHEALVRSIGLTTRWAKRAKEAVGKAGAGCWGPGAGELGVRDSGFGTRDSELGTAGSASGVSTPYSEFKIPDFGSNAADRESRASDAEFKIQDSKFKTADPEPRVPNPESRDPRPESLTSDSEIRIPNSGLRIPRPESPLSLVPCPESRAPSPESLAPALFGIVQGGTDKELRRQSAEALLDLDFEGYAVGGLAVGEPKSEMYETVEYTAGLLPRDRPRYLMGVGTPDDLLEGVARGIDMFDCVMPTRNARNACAFTSEGKIIIKNARYARDEGPLDPACACAVCQRYSRRYLRHLFVTGEMLGPMLATHHNIHFYLDTMRRMRQSLLFGEFAEFRNRMRSKL